LSSTGPSSDPPALPEPLAVWELDPLFDPPDVPALPLLLPPQAAAMMENTMTIASRTANSRLFVISLKPLSFTYSTPV
jgi:hypothetical protein